MNCFQNLLQRYRDYCQREQDKLTEEEEERERVKRQNEAYMAKVAAIMAHRELPMGED